MEKAKKSGRQYDYGARFYDPVIGRWNVVDKLAGHPNQIDKSPYAYVWNNPVKLTDPDGNCPGCIIAILELVAGLTAAEVATTAAVATTAYIVVNNANKAKNSGKSFNFFPSGEGTEFFRPNVNTEDKSNTEEGSKSEEVDYLNGGNRISPDKIKSPPAKRGDAPIGEDGFSIELHHRNQQNDDPLDEMTRTDHRGGGNYRKNHSNTGDKKSTVDRKSASKTRVNHWTSEWDKGRFIFDKNGKIIN